MKTLAKRVMCAAFALVMTAFSGVCAVASGNVVYSGAAGCGKRIAITFDDGPHPRKTAEILDSLAERSVRATSFVVGEHAKL